MAVTLDVHPQLDEEALAELAVRIRAVVREAVLAGIGDVLGDLASS